MKLSIRKQHKILNTLIDLSREYQDNTIFIVPRILKIILRSSQQAS